MKIYEKDLSIIIPFVGEYPQIIFTIQAIAQNVLESDIDFEIIAVNNYCEEAKYQAKTSANNGLNKFIKAYNTKLDSGEEVLSDAYQLHKDIYQTYEDRSGEAIKACAKINPWLKYLEVTDRLSHWEAKRKACQIAKGKHLLFVDGHTIAGAGSIPNMFKTYNSDKKYHEQSSFHLPVTYKILESHKLIYKLKIQDNFYGYSFTGFRFNEEPYEVPCMSTCGMMISRHLYDKIGGWPKHMAMYGGGENYINFTLAVMGYKKFIFPGGTLHHHGDKRDYHYTYDGMLWNRLIAHYLFGGEKGLLALADQSKGKKEVIYGMVEKIKIEQKEHRARIKAGTKFDIESWVENWIDKS